MDGRAPLGDRLNMVYSGCSVTYGHGEAVVTATGMETEMGHIAGILNNEKQTQTPLQKKLARLGRMLGVLAIAICAVIFAAIIVFMHRSNIGRLLRGEENRFGKKKGKVQK